MNDRDAFRLKPAPNGNPRGKPTPGEVDEYLREVNLILYGNENGPLPPEEPDEETK